MPETAYTLITKYAAWWSGLLMISLYILGVALARYLGASLDLGVFFLGLLASLFLYLATAFTDKFFSQIRRDRLVPVIYRDPQGLGGLSRGAWTLIGAALFFALTASCTVLLLSTGALSPAGVLYLLIGVAGCVVYTVPPFRLADRGYGELLAAVLIVGLLPAFSFLLQYGELHRFLPMATVPVLALFLALILIVQLTTYPENLRLNRRNLLLRLGWENGMTFHNILVLFAFAMIALAALFDFPMFAWLPALLLLLPGAYQIWTLNRVALGAKPNWNSLVFFSVGILGAMVYLFTFGFFVN